MNGRRDCPKNIMALLTLSGDDRMVATWRSVNGVGRINEVTLR